YDRPRRAPLSVRWAWSVRRLLPFLQDHLACDAPVGTHDAAAGMCRRSAQVQVVDWSAIIGPARHGPQEEKLLERKLALKNISLRQSKFLFQVVRRQHLLFDDDFLDI